MFFLGTRIIFSHVLFLLTASSRESNPIKPNAHMRQYKELSRYRPVVSVTVQALIKVSQPIARGERDESNQWSPTQSVIASKPNFVHHASPPNGTVHWSIMFTIKLSDVLFL